MCGIWLYVSKHLGDAQPYTKGELYQAFQAIQARGPDRSQWLTLNAPGQIQISLGFHRLAIMDTSTQGDQPFVYEHGSHTIYAMINGEIYNHKQLRQEILAGQNVPMKGNSDCEIVPQLYLQGGIEAVVHSIEGEWAGLIVDIDQVSHQVIIYAMRDPFGVRPLFYSDDNQGLGFSSELKGLSPLGRASPFLPASYTQILMTPIRECEPFGIKVKNRRGAVLVKQSYHHYYPYTYTINRCLTSDDIGTSIRRLLTEAVISRLESDRPLGCLLSGGIDSSLVSAIAARHLAQQGQCLRTFSLGMADSPDLYYAQMVAEHIGSIHTVIAFDPELALPTLREVIRVIESYDITTVRASVCQYWLLQWIAKNTEIKVILSGEYADECAGSYLYFHNAPTPEAFQDESQRLLQDIYLFDALRADRCLANCGIEARVPFSQRQLIEFYQTIDPIQRQPRPSPLLGIETKVEKAPLREAFAGTDLLPDPVLKRIKNGLSDSISPDRKSWYQYIEEYVDTQISELEFHREAPEYAHNPPQTKEAYYYRKIFDEIYEEKQAHVIPYYWLPKWSGNITNPSARVLSVFHAENDK